MKDGSSTPAPIETPVGTDGGGRGGPSWAPAPPPSSCLCISSALPRASAAWRRTDSLKAKASVNFLASSAAAASRRRTSSAAAWAACAVWAGAGGRCSSRWRNRSCNRSHRRFCTVSSYATSLPLILAYVNAALSLSGFIQSLESADGDSWTHCAVAPIPGSGRCVGEAGGDGRMGGRLVDAPTPRTICATRPRAPLPRPCANLGDGKWGNDGSVAVASGAGRTSSSSSKGCKVEEDATPGGAGGACNPSSAGGPPSTPTRGVIISCVDGMCHWRVGMDISSSKYFDSSHGTRALLTT